MVPCVVWFAPFQRIAREALAERLGLLLMCVSHSTNMLSTDLEWRRVVIGDRYMSTFLATSNEEDLLIHEVSDEALEAASGNEVAARYTLANCTGLSECPG